MILTIAVKRVFALTIDCGFDPYGSPPPCKSTTQAMKMFWVFIFILYGRIMFEIYHITNTPRGQKGCPLLPSIRDTQLIN